MKEKNKVVFAALFGALFLAPGLVFADVNIKLYIQGPGSSILVEANTELSVPETCTVQDSTGADHEFSGHKAPCAIQSAADKGLISDFAFKDFGGELGVFLDSINGIVTGAAPDYPFWNLWHNAQISDVGIGQIALSEGDALQLTYGPWKTEIISSSVPLAGGGCCGPPSIIKAPDAKAMVEFLTSRKQEGGSFGNALFDDWAAIALGAFDPQHPAAEELRLYLAGNPDPGVSLGSSVLSFERRAMAVMALGLSPYSGTSINYIEKIAQAYDGEQVGDRNLVNDDIFGLLVLRKAGYGADLEMIQNITAFIINQQDSRGSFGGVDMTAAAVQSLDLVVSSSKEARDSIAKAKIYLRSQQADKGGFYNPDSTSWAMQAIAVFGDDWRAWDREGNTPGEYLASLQKEDGSVESAVPVWSTAYAIPAAMGKPWGEILGEFEKPEVPQQESAILSGESPAVPEQEQVLQEASQAQQTPQAALKEIETELRVIEGKVALLELEVSLVYAEYQLAQKQNQLVLLPQEEIGEEQNAAPEPFAALVEETNIENGREEQLAATASTTAPQLLSSRQGQILLVLALGVLAFLVLGGWRIASPFMPKRSPQSPEPLQPPPL